MIDVPLGDRRLRQMTFSVAGSPPPTVVISFSADLFQPTWSGELEYRIKTELAKSVVDMISTTGALGL
jgi:hypothetical protein